MSGGKKDIKSKAKTKTQKSNKNITEQKWFVPVVCVGVLVVLYLVVQALFFNKVETTIKTVDEVMKGANNTTINTTTENSTSSSSNTKWREVLKDYESWTNKYVDFMKKYYKASSNDQMEMISDYMSLTSEMSKWTSKLDDIYGDLSGDDLTEYLTTMARISKKLQEIYQ